MIDQLLKEIGLSEKESEMYITLLRHGTQSTSFLSKKLKMNRGTGYVILHQLLEKGLAKKVTKKGVQYFSPLDPKNLLNYLESQKRKIETSQGKVEAMMSQLQAITNPLTAKPKIEFFDGPEGARTVMESTLKAKDTTIYAFLSLADVIDFTGAGLYEEFEQRRITAGYKLHAIRTREKDKEALELDPRSKHHTTSASDKREVRYAPADLAFPMTMYLYDDKVAILSSRRENFAVSIQSSELSHMLRKLFDLLWESLNHNKIKVGIIHSLSGSMAISERSLVDAELMAIEEINEAGGILGKQIEPIVVNGCSDPKIFAAEVKRLIEKEGVCSVFGGYISTTRKAMLPTLEKQNHLLWYPTQHEGLEQSSNIIYVGSTSSQPVVAGIEWACEHLGSSFYLVGTDDVFSQVNNEIIKCCIEELGGKTTGESVVARGTKEFTSVITEIKKKKPDVIVNMINGETHMHFFKQLRKAGIDSKKIPTISLSLTEEEIRSIGPKHLENDYAVVSYLQSIHTEHNNKFVKNFKEKYGSHRVIGDGMASAYIAVQLFAKALKKAGSEDSQAIAEAAKGLSVDTPDGKVLIDPESQYAHRKVRVGQIRADGQIDILWESKRPLRPDPYPKYKTRAEWESFLTMLNKKWEGKWEK